MARFRNGFRVGSIGRSRSCERQPLRPSAFAARAACRPGAGQELAAAVFTGAVNPRAAGLLVLLEGCVSQGLLQAGGRLLCWLLLVALALFEGLLPLCPRRSPVSSGGLCLGRLLAGLDAVPGTSSPGVVAASSFFAGFFDLSFLAAPFLLAANSCLAWASLASRRVLSS